MTVAAGVGAAAPAQATGTGAVGGVAQVAAGPAATPAVNGRLAFTHRSQIYTISPDGTGRRTLTSDGRNYHATWSPDGTQLAYVHEPFAGEQDIWTMRADGSDKRQVTRGHLVPGGVAWSPDSTRLTLVSGHFAYTVSVRTGAFTEMTGCFADGAEQGHNRPLAAPCRPGDQIETLPAQGTPAWSPDGKYIVFTSGGGAYDTIINLWAGNDRSVYVVAGEGGRGTNGLFGDQYSWYPDGTSLAVPHQGPGESTDPYAPPTIRTYATPLPGDTAVAVPEVAYDSQPAFSPDGTQLAVTNNAHGTAVYLVRLSDGQRHKLVAGQQPSWQPTT